MRVNFVVVPFDMSAIPCTEKPPYVSRMAAIMDHYENPRDGESTTHSLNYVALLHLFYRHHLLKNLEYCLKKVVFNHRLQLKSTDPMFLNWHCADFFDISPAQRHELFSHVPKW